jgi:hypothetical protein
MPRVIKLGKRVSNIVGEIEKEREEERLGEAGLNVVMHVPHIGRRYRNASELNKDFRNRIEKAERLPEPERLKKLSYIIAELGVLKLRVTNPDAAKIVEKYISEAKEKYNEKRGKQ